MQKYDPIPFINKFQVLQTQKKYQQIYSVKWSQASGIYIYLLVFSH